METASQSKTVPCPECNAAVGVADDAVANEILPCPECGVELELTHLDPPRLELAPEVEEDWGE